MTTNATHPGKQAWLQALMLRDPGRWSSRLGALVMWMKTLGRGRRRQFARVSAGVGASAAGIALLALLAGPMTPPAAAASGATITVNNTTCTLVDAIKAANTNAAVNGCVAGSNTGADTIKLTANVVLSSSYGNYFGADTATPKIVTGSNIIIDGQGKTISRDAGAGNMRFFATAWGSNLTLSNVTISGGDVDAAGGAIYSGGDLAVTNSTFVNNQATGSGGAIYADDTTVVSGTTFILNSSGKYGGAVYLSEVQGTFDNVDFSTNSAVKGGALGAYEYSDAVISNSTITGNSASSDGGAIHTQKGSTLAISDTSIDMNQAAANGGGVWIDGDFSITGSSFYGNLSDSKGGAIYSAGDDAVGVITSSLLISNTAYDNSAGAMYFYNGTLTIDEVIFENNSGNSGGALKVAYGTVTITNSIFENNVSVSNGGAIYIDEADTVIIGSQFTGNTGTFGGGAIYSYYDSTLKIYDSEFSGNRAPNGDGGVIYSYSLETKIVNSTFSGNSSSSFGGAIYVGAYGLTITNSTFISNTADYGGAIYHGGDDAATISNSIVSGNRATTAGNELYANDAIRVIGGVVGDSGETKAEAFEAVFFYDSPYDATSDGTVAGGVALSSIVKPTLANNGGQRALPGNKNTRTHNLPEGSPAIDIVPGASCDPDTDQRGFNRPYGDGCDAGAVEYYPSSVYVFMSTDQAGTIAGLGSYGNSDILMWDGDVWTKWLSAEAISAIRSPKANINAFWIPDADQQEVVVGFKAGSVKLDGVNRRILGTQLAKWDGSAFSLYFDGPDVGLSSGTKERIDALHVLPSAPAGRNGCEAYLLISTEGRSKVRINGQGTVVGGEDLLGFCATSLGENTAGTWEIVVDGSAEGMPRNSLDSVSASDDGKTIYLTTRGVFSVDGVSGGHSMVYVFDEATGTFSGPAFEAAANGLTQQVDGLQVMGELSDN